MQIKLRLDIFCKSNASWWHVCQVVAISWKGKNHILNLVTNIFNLPLPDGSIQSNWIDYVFRLKSCFFKSMSFIDLMFIHVQKANSIIKLSENWETLKTKRKKGFCNEWKIIWIENWRFYFRYDEFRFFTKKQ